MLDKKKFLASTGQGLVFDVFLSSDMHSNWILDRRETLNGMSYVSNPCFVVRSLVFTNLQTTKGAVGQPQELSFSVAPKILSNLSPFGCSDCCGQM